MLGGGGNRLLGVRNSQGDLLTPDRALLSTNKTLEISLLPYPHPRVFSHSFPLVGGRRGSQPHKVGCPDRSLRLPAARQKGCPVF